MERFGDFLHYLWHITHPGQSCGEDSFQLVTDVGLQRQMVRDAFANSVEAEELLNLPGISDEVREMEERAHVARIVAIQPVLPLLISQADFMGHAATALQIHRVGEENVTEEEYERTQIVFTQVIKASIVAAVSTAVGMGVLQVNKEVTTDVD